MIYKEGCQYKKAYIIGMKLTQAQQKQFKLFSEENSKHNQLMKVVDPKNFIENGKVKFGGKDPGRTWKIKQERLSNRYSTRLYEMIRVNCNP